MTALSLVGDSLAANNFGDTRSGGLAGPMGLFIISLLAIGTILLIRNMNKRLRRLPDHFPAGGPGLREKIKSAGPAPASTDDTADESTVPGPDQRDAGRP
jgi:hypothetical protein